MWRTGTLLALILSVAVACSGGPTTSTASTDDPRTGSGNTVPGLAEPTSSGGARLWVRLPSDEQLDAPVEGVLRWEADAGCFLLERNELLFGVVWPSGTTAEPSGPSLVTSGGETLAVGAYVVGSGGYLDVAAALGMPAACAPEADEIAVFNADSTLGVRP